MTDTNAIQIAIQANLPVILWGPPGVGKTSWINSLAGALGWPCVTLIAAVRDPADFGGYPVPGHGQGPEAEAEATVAALSGVGILHFAPPPWARRLAHLAAGGHPALLFLDEASAATPAVQAALLRVVLDKVVGDLALPSVVRVVAAANQGVGVWDLTPQLANRFAHFAWELDVDSWCAGAVGGFAPPVPIRLPEDWRDRVGVERAQIAAFVQRQRHLLLALPDSETAASKAWPSPRTWTMAASLLAAAGSVRASKDTRIALVASCVGDGAAIEYLSWLEEADLPDPEALLAKPEGFTLPDRGDRQFAVLGSVAAAVCARPAPDRWLAAWKILAAAADQQAADVAATAAKAMCDLYVARGAVLKIKLPQNEVRRFLPILRATGEAV